MKYLVILAAALGVFLGIVIIHGCGPSWPVQWKATEATKQAQGLVEDNLGLARPRADAVGKVHIDEAAGAARAVTSYVGVPAVRAKPVAVHTQEEIEKALADTAAGIKRPVITQAEADARRKAATPGDIARALPKEIEESVLPWADLGIALVSIFAPVAGATALVYRKKFKTALDAFEQTVEGVDAADLSKEQKTALAIAQDRKAKALVDETQAKQATAKKVA